VNQQFYKNMALWVVILVMILLFRDQIGAGAGAFFGSFDSEDVQLPEEDTTQPPPDGGIGGTEGDHGGKRDAGTRRSSD